MANVKFYQGTYANAGNNPANAIGFLTGGPGEAASDTGYGYINLGTELVATKYLKELSQRGLTLATSSYNQILSLNWESNASVISTTRLVKAADVTHKSGTPSVYDYTPLDTDIMTAAGVEAYVSRANETNDKYHTLGSNFGSTTWYQATLTGQNGAGNITLTLPIADTSGEGYNYSTDDTHITTPKQVSDFFSGLSGGMRYMGELTSNVVGDTDGNIKRNGKPGDVYICGNANGITVGTSPNQRKIEYGDMVVLNMNYTANTVLAYSNSKWNFDQFERNLDGSVKISSAMTSGKFVTSTGTDTITSMTTAVRAAMGSIIVGAGSNADPTWLAKGTTGQIIKATSSTIEWADYYYQTVAAHSTDANKIVVTPYTNGTAGTATTITINNVENADKVKQTVSSTNSDKPILIGAGGTSGTAQAVNYSSSISANASTGTIKATEMTLGTGGSTINVYSTLTWQTIPSS